MNTRTFITLSVLSALVTITPAQAQFATFANDGGVEFSRAGDSFSGAGVIPAFVLGTTTYTNVGLTFGGSLDVLGASSLVSMGAVGPGSFVFRSSGGDTLLTVDFDSASLMSNGAWLTAFNATYAAEDNVRFGGLVVPSADPRAGFSFSLSPKIGVPNFYNASFSATGNVEAVPEPATLTAMGIGALALLRRRRR